METWRGPTRGTVHISAFNGATAFRRWKLVGGGGHLGRRRVPSMGPPPFGDGNARAGVPPAAADRPSMGPPPFGDGNLHHGLGVNGQIHVAVQPSMGPPPFGDGNLMLQVPFGSMPVPCLPSMGPPPFGDGNWISPSVLLAVLPLPSMGPPPFGDGNPPSP